MCLILNHKNSFYEILAVKSPNQPVIDLNHNNSFDSNENFTVPDIEIIANPADKLSASELFIFNELAKNHAKTILFNKKVQIKNRELYIADKKYSDLFNQSGFNYKISPEEYNKNIKNIRTESFYILNPHNNKYHKIGCPHSTKAENIIVINKTQLTPNAQPCKICLPAVTNSKLKDDKIQSDTIKIFFTDHTTKLKPSKNCSTNICKELVSQINKTKNTLDIAIYGYNHIPEIESAIVSALNRGVKIRMVYDTDSKENTDYSDSKRLAALIKNARNDYNSEGNSKYSNQLMHNKFFIFDNNTVLTGSANLSQNDMSGFNSNAAIILENPQIAKIYTHEFEQLYSGKFHNLKKLTTNNHIKLANSDITVYFSPQDRITKNHIIPLIKQAQKEINIPAFLITDKWLADELIASHNRGVKIKIILDASSSHSKYSQIKYLRNNGIKVKVENYAGKIHNKSILIDDNITIIGSMNFSRSGQNNNDENVIVLKNNAITTSYRNYFEYMWSRIDEKWLNSTPRAEGKDSIGSCNDGLDNNYDGLIDKDDIACK